jgi:hypothetical protein
MIQLTSFFLFLLFFFFLKSKKKFKTILYAIIIYICNYFLIKFLFDNYITVYSIHALFHFHPSYLRSLLTKKVSSLNALILQPCTNKNKGFHLGENSVYNMFQDKAYVRRSATNKQIFQSNKLYTRNIEFKNLKKKKRAI